MSNKTVPPAPMTDEDDGWVEKSSDNGDLISWKPGVVMTGVFIGPRVITLPISEQNPDIGDGTGGPAEMLVFETGHGTRWSTWQPFQIAEAFKDIAIGTECRIECTGERKAKAGNVKVFSIKTREPKQLSLPVEPF